MITTRQIELIYFVVPELMNLIISAGQGGSKAGPRRMPLHLHAWSAVVLDVTRTAPSFCTPLSEMYGTTSFEKGQNKSLSMDSI
jgi:hypothetical protein